MRFRALLAGVLVPIVLWVVLPVGSLGQSRLSRLNGKIESTQGKIERKKGTEHVLTTQISRYNARIDRLQGGITTLTARVTRLQVDLDRKQALLSRIQSDLRFQRARRVRLRSRLTVARRTLAQRLVELYQSDRPDIVSVLLNSKGFADLLEREEFISRISDQDRRIIDLVATAKADAADAAQRLAGLERRQRSITAAVLGRRDQIAAARSQLVDRRQGYASQRQHRARALSVTRGQRHELEGKLSDLQAEENKIQNALAAAHGLPTLPAGPIRGGGQMIWPVNGPITSPFCERRPWEACHPGIDIGVPAGTPIRAAASGTIVLMQNVASSGGYGNFTCIAHTSSLSSCYAHQSRFATSMGAHVTQGQVIGYTGCTGRCYGDHLHFEVRVNGSVVNPLNYL
jgi:peptidoglycan DL-endopeptidase CwlO